MVLDKLGLIRPKYVTVTRYPRTCVNGSVEVLRINSLPNDNIFDWFKLKAFADDKINLPKKQNSFSGCEENIVRKGENAGYQHFLLFPQCFQKASLSGSLKVKTVW